MDTPIGLIITMHMFKIFLEISLVASVAFLANIVYINLNKGGGEK